VEAAAREAENEAELAAASEAAAVDEGAAPGPSSAEGGSLPSDDPAAPAPASAPSPSNAGGGMQSPSPEENLAAARAELATIEAEVEKLVFPHDLVREAHRRTRANSSMLWQACIGQTRWRFAIFYYVRWTIAILGGLLLLHLLLTMAVFSSSHLSVHEGPAGEGMGAILVDPHGKPAAATAEFLGLRSLWSFPELPLSELRAVQDVVFLHNFAHHTMRIASVARSGDTGAILLQSADRSGVRILPGGLARWRESVGGTYLPEVSLSNSTTNGAHSWTTSSLMSTDVLIDFSN